MKNHTKIYFKSLNVSFDPVSGWHDCKSELSGSPAIDIHHIVTREDRIENLMAVTREEHNKYGEIKSKMSWLLRQHRAFLEIARIDFDKVWFNEWIQFYED